MLHHSNEVDDYAHDCDSIGPNVVEPDPDPSPPVIAPKGLQYNHCYDPFAPFAFNVNVPNKNDSGPDMMMVDFNAISNFLPALWIMKMILNGHNMLVPSAQSRCFQMPHVCLERI